MLKGLRPILGANPRVLILGSFPSVASLQKRQYYGHPQNNFWRLLGTVLGEPLAESTYAWRVAILKRRKVAVWDSLASCRREGSLDSAIRDARANPIGALIERAKIRAVFCNGKLAWDAFRKRHGEIAVPVLRLPSSSPANASIPYPVKLKRWRTIAPYLLK